MQWVDLSAQQRARRRYAVIGAVIVASLAGLLVGWSEAQSKDLTPAEVVALRFPSAWNNLAARSVPAVTAVAKNQIVFDPNPSYDLASADSKPVIPSGVLAYGDPVESIARPQASPAPEARPAERRASLVPTVPAAKPKPDNHILNDAQIASIKARLKLTPDQQRYWPGVETALRGLAYKINKSGGKLASIDAEGPEVQQLKNAAIPLIMMFSEQQKNEVRQLVQVMGLQKLAAQF
jgi:hypothetical protein